MDALATMQIVPLSIREDGTIHVTGSRVTLDAILARYTTGESAAAIREAFPTLSLAQIYGVLQYYHEHKAEVEAYVRRREEEADELQRQHSVHAAANDLRAQLLARRARRNAAE